jgi:hypothetical protein
MISYGQRVEYKNKTSTLVKLISLPIDEVGSDGGGAARERDNSNF